MSERVRERTSKERERRGERKKSSQGVTQKTKTKRAKCVPDSEGNAEEGIVRSTVGA